MPRLFCLLFCLFSTPFFAEAIVGKANQLIPSRQSGGGNQSVAIEKDSLPPFSADQKVEAEKGAGGDILGRSALQIMGGAWIVFVSAFLFVIPGILTLGAATAIAILGLLAGFSSYALGIRAIKMGAKKERQIIRGIFWSLPFLLVGLVLMFFWAAEFG